MLMEQAHLPVIGIASPVAVVAQCKELREALHRRVRMIVIHRIFELPADGLDLGIQ